MSGHQDWNHFVSVTAVNAEIGVESQDRRPAMQLRKPLLIDPEGRRLSLTKFFPVLRIDGQAGRQPFDACNEVFRKVITGQFLRVRFLPKRSLQGLPYKSRPGQASCAGFLFRAANVEPFPTGGFESKIPLMPTLRLLSLSLLATYVALAQPISFRGTLDRQTIILRHVRSACPTGTNTTNFLNEGPAFNTIQFPGGLSCEAFQVNNVSARWRFPSAPISGTIAGDTAATVSLSSSAADPISIAISGSAGWQGSPNEGAHSFYSDTRLNDFAGGACGIPANRVSNIVLFQPGTAPLDVSAECTMNQAGPLTIVPSSRRVENNRLVSFEAVLTLTALADLAHGNQFGQGGWRGGIYTVTVQAVYKFVSTVDLGIDHIEVVQVTQSATNEIPLVANKKTRIRIFGKLLSGGSEPIRGIPMRIRAFRGNTELPGSPAIFTPPNAGTWRNPPRDVTVHDYFAPDSWTSEGQFRVEAQINPNRDIDESNYENNTQSATVTFTAKPTLSIRYFPVCFDVPGYERACPSGSIAGYDSILKLIFPVAESRYSYLPLDIPEKVSTFLLDNDQRRDDFANFVNRMDAWAQARLDPYDQLVAWIPFGYAGNLLGRADAKFAGGTSRTSFNAEVSGDANLSALTLAHEVGHNYGLRHTRRDDSCGSADGNSDWPHIDSLIQEFGFSGSTTRIYRSAIYQDVMSYCSRQWIAPFHYLKLFNGDFIPGGRAASIQTPQAEAADLWIITGVVHRTVLQARIDPIFAVNSTQERLTGSTTGTFCIRVFGQTITNHCFSPSFRDPETSQETDQAAFLFRLLASAGVTRIALMRGEQELAVRVLSANAPTVQFLSPASGETWTDASPRPIRWQAADTDADALTYSLLYSSDNGATWLPIAVDLTTTEYSLNPALIKGGSQVLFRIAASDGFRTTLATAGPINVQQRPAIAADGQPVNLGSTAIGRTDRRIASLRNSGTGPLSITSITSSDPRFVLDLPALPISIPSGRTFPLGIFFTPAMATAASSTINVRSNATGQETFTFQVNATGADGRTAIAEISPAAVVFRPVAITQRASAAIAISNQSFVDMTARWSISGAAFRLESAPPFPVTIAQGEQRDITIIFESATAGTFTGALTFTTSDPARPTVTIPLTATAFDAAPQATGPRINSGGVVDAAQFQPVVSPGGIATIFGVELALAVQEAGTVPLPRILTGVRVLVNGIAAPIFFIAPGQINFQVPFEIASGTTAQVVVERNGVQTNTETVRVAEYAPAIFRNAATNEPIVTRYPSNDVITAQNPSLAGDVLIIYLTGIGGLTSTPATGDLTPGSPLPASRVQATVTLGGQPVTVLYAGLAPFFIGLAQLNIQLPATLPPGARLTLELRFGNSAAPPVILPVAFDAPAVPAISAQPAALAFGEVPVGQSRDLPLTIRNNGTAQLNVTAISGANPRYTLAGLAAPFSIAPSAAQAITVRFSPTAAGAQPGNLTITSNDPANPTVSITLTGNGVAATVQQPAIETTPAELAFATVTVGQPKDLMLTVRNTGTAPLNVTGITSSNPLFTITGASTATVGPAGQQNFTVRFSPTAAGDQTATLTIASNDPVRPSVTVRASGQGVAAGPQTLVLQVDDNTFERSIALSEGGDSYFINRLTPPSYPATLKSVRIYFSNQGLSPGDSFTLLSAAHPSGAAELGTPSFRSTNGRVSAQLQFNEFEVPAMTIQSGDFLVGFVVSSVSGMLPMAVDQTAPYRNRSYASINGTLFVPIGNFTVAGQGNFAIRAVVETGN